jgi:hypothetical protein
LHPGKATADRGLEKKKSISSAVRFIGIKGTKKEQKTKRKSCFFISFRGKAPKVR